MGGSELGRWLRWDDSPEDDRPARPERVRRPNDELLEANARYSFFEPDEDGEEVPLPQDRIDAHLLETGAPSLREFPKEEPDDIPELVEAVAVELSSGRVGAVGEVTVTRASLDLARDPVVIEHARGVQIGDGNRQFNRWRFEAREPRADVSRLLEQHPGAERALAMAAENPRGVRTRIALWWAFRKGSLWDGELAENSPPEDGDTIEIDTGDASGDLAVIGAADGVQVGDRGIQRNEFSREVIGPELNLGVLLRHDLKLASMLATALQHPEAEVAQAALARELQKAVGQASGQADEISLPFDGLPVGGEGVQIGDDNIRRDTIQVIAGQFTLTGWPDAVSPDEDDASTEEVATQPDDAPRDRDRPPERVTQALLQALENPRILDHATAALLTFDRVSGGLRLPEGRPGAAVEGQPEVTLLPGRPGQDEPAREEGGATAVVRGSTRAIARAVTSDTLDAPALLAYVRDNLGADAQHRLTRIVFLDLERGVGLAVAVDQRTGKAWVTAVVSAAASTTGAFIAYSVNPR